MRHTILLTHLHHVRVVLALHLLCIHCGCCSLQVVSTSVGGVPEVLPPHLIRLAEPGAKGSVSVSVFD